MELRVDELLLLEHLTYLVDIAPLQSILQYDGYSVRALVTSIDIHLLESEKNYESYLTGSDWKNILRAIMHNDTLSDMIVSWPHLDDAPGAGGGISAVFLHKDSHQAVFAFRGTGPQEWLDDFVAGNKTDTQQQKNAHAWFSVVVEELDVANWFITVTGHSKGGNKAKYITLLDDRVNRCVAFDGQGFSDEFIRTYADSIRARQHLIENHNVDYDYVNILLNDIGERTFYEGFDLGKGGFFENHSPVTFFEFAQDGSYRMQLAENGQSAEMQELDFFLNSILRSMGEKDQDETLYLIGSLVEGGFLVSHKQSTKEEYIRFFMELVVNPQYTDDLAYLIAYFIRYNQKDPRLMSAIKTVFARYHMDGFIETMGMVQDILEWDRFDHAFSLAGQLTSMIPDKILGHLIRRIQKKRGIQLTTDELRILLSILNMVSERMPNIKIVENGKDMTVEDL